MTWPSSGRNIPIARRTSTDLPEPDAPVMKSISFGSSSKLTSRKTCKSSKLMETWRNSTAGVSLFVEAIKPCLIDWNLTPALFQTPHCQSHLVFDQNVLSGDRWVRPSRPLCHVIFLEHLRSLVRRARNNQLIVIGQRED